MSQTRFLTGRQRRIRLHGTYSYDVMVRAFPGPGGTISIASQNTVSGVTTYYPQIQGGFVQNGGGRAGLDRQYVEGSILNPASGLWVGFGAMARFENTVYTPFVGGTTELAIYGTAGNELARISYNLGAGAVPPSGISPPFTALLDSSSHSTLLDTTDSGDWEVYVDVAEALNHLDMPGESTVIYNPSSYLLHSFFEVTRVGGESVVRKASGSSVAQTVVSYSTYALIDNLYHPFSEGSISCIPYSGGPSRTGTCTITATYDGDGFTHSPKAQSYSSGAGSGDEDSVTMTNGTGAFANKFPIWRLYTHKIKGLTLGGVDGDNSTIYATLNMQNSSLTSRTGAGELTFAWLWKNDSGSISFTPTGGSTSTQSTADPTPTAEVINATTNPVGFRNYDWVGGPGAMPAGANEKTDGYIFYEGIRLPFVTVHHAGERWVTRDPFQPLQTLVGPRGWLERDGDTHGANNTIVSLPSGPPAVVRLTVGNVQLAPFTSLRRRQHARLTENFSLDGRYIKIRFRTVGTANQPLRLVFYPSSGSDHDVFETTSGADGVWVERTFDMLNAADYGPGVYSGTEILLTVPRAKPEFSSTVPRQSFGRLEVDRLTENTVYEIEWIKTEKRDFASIHAFGDVEPLIGVTWASGVVDGIPSSVPHSPPGTLATGENPPGWVVAETTPPTPGKPLLFDESSVIVQYYPIDYLFESDYAGGPGSRVEGAGRTRDGVVLDADASDSGSPVPVDVYMGGAFLSLYPGCGDLFGAASGAYGMTVEADWTYPTRNAVHGLMIGSDSEVVIEQRNDANTADDGYESGRDAPDGFDYFSTEDPYVRPRKNQRVWVDPDRPTTTWYIAKIADINRISHARRWVIIRLPDGANPPDALSHHLFGYYAHLYLDTDGNIAFRRTSGGSPDKPGSLRSPVVVRSKDESSMTLGGPALMVNTCIVGEMRAAWQEDTGTVEAVSYDDGATWPTTPVSLEGEGENPQMVISEGKTPRYFQGVTGWDTGLVGIAAFVETDGSNGVIKARLLRAEGAWGDVFTLKQKDGAQTLKDLIVKPLGFDLIQMHEGPGRWLLVVTVEDEEEISIWASSDLRDGEASFTRITDP